MSFETENLDDVYGAKTPDEARALYNKWSADYDADTLADGFWLPFLAAGLYARHVGQGRGAILDAGCGTGLVGVTLHQMGYGPITGCDLSPEMMQIADRTGAYEKFIEADMGANLPFADDQFAGFISTGSFGPGHAPPETLNHLARVTAPGGIGVFNVVENTWQDQGFPQMITQLQQGGKWETLQEVKHARAFLVGEADLMVRLFVMRML